MKAIYKFKSARKIALFGVMLSALTRVEFTEAIGSRPEKGRIWNKRDRTSVPPTDNKLQRFGRAARFAPLDLVISLNPMEKVEPNI